MPCLLPQAFWGGKAERGALSCVFFPVATPGCLQQCWCWLHASVGVLEFPPRWLVVIPNLYGPAGGDRGTPRSSQLWEGRRDALLLLTKGTNAYPCHCSLGRAAPTAPQMLRARCACRDPLCLPGRPSVPYPCAQNGSSAFLPADSQRGTGCSGNPVWFGCSSASAVPDDASNPWQQQDRGTECFGAHREGCSLRGASPGGKEGRKEAVGLTSAALSARHCAVGDPPTSALQLSCKVS